MNRLQNEASPYLLQHASNPVDWYPWGREAFEKAEREDKPVFLSIGYSTCHWCHVMAHESFEDKEVAAVLNRDFVSVKVDKEERPDIDSVYMEVCVSLTGSGGWPMTIIMDHRGRPFFAGTYFPKRGRYGMTGLIELLGAASETWRTDRDDLLASAEKITAHIAAAAKRAGAVYGDSLKVSSAEITERGIQYYKSAFDQRYGGFGGAPKFPAAHNLLFLLQAYECLHNPVCLDMAGKTLLAMASGGIFDQIGYGFSRYSTDEKWLAPHFEKMLYDNALLVMAYTKAYELTKEPAYRSVAEKTLLYIEREMTHPQGGFYSAQDADSGGVEGGYYVLTPGEIVSVLGKADGEVFCEAYDITLEGNFEGQSIPNLIKNPLRGAIISSEPETDPGSPLIRLYEYRKNRVTLHKDDKLLTSWNALMITALADASAVFGSGSYLHMAERGAEFIEKNLTGGDTLFTSCRDGRRTGGGVLDDYAYYIQALLRLHKITSKQPYLERARQLTGKVIADFFDRENAGFFLTSADALELISRPKETNDGALPSGNSTMADNLLELDLLTGEYGGILGRQFAFMSAKTARENAGSSFFLYSLLKKNYAVKSSANYICDENGCRLAT